MLFLLFVLSAQYCSSKDNPMEHGIRSALFLATVFVKKEGCTDIKQDNFTIHERQCSIQQFFSCYTTMQQCRGAQGKTMLYNSFFMLCNRATLKRSKWRRRKTMHYSRYFMLCNSASVKSSTQRHIGKQCLSIASFNYEDGATWSSFV